MGKVAELKLTIEEALNDRAVELSYMIQDSIEDLIDEARDDMCDIFMGIMDDYGFDSEDVEAIGIDMGEMIVEAIDDNRDW